MLKHVCDRCGGYPAWEMLDPTEWLCFDCILADEAIDKEKDDKAE